MSLDMDLDDEEYWDFTWHEFAYDVFANVEAMYESAGGQNKGYYFGNSQGTVQMTVALVLDEDRLLSKLNRVVQLAPCVIYGEATEPEMTQEAFDVVGQVQSLDIFSIPTADWETDTQIICNNLDALACNKAINTPAD